VSDQGKHYLVGGGEHIDADNPPESIRLILDAASSSVTITQITDFRLTGMDNTCQFNGLATVDGDPTENRRCVVNCTIGEPRGVPQDFLIY